MRITTGTTFLILGFSAVGFYGYKLVFSDSNDGTVVHPICLEYLGQNKPLPDEIDCSVKANQLDVIEKNDGYISWPKGTDKSNESYFSYKPYSNEFLKARDIQILEVAYDVMQGDLQTALAIVYVKTATQISPIYTIDAGNRCNDGFPRVVDADANSIVYTTQATAFRLVNVNDQTDWWLLMKKAIAYGLDKNSFRAPPTFSNWGPYTELNHQLDGCVGAIQKSFDVGSGSIEIEGVYLDRDLLRNSGIGNLEYCFKDWVDHLPEPDHLNFINIEDWEDSLSKLPMYCEPSLLPWVPFE